jgi:hypothetical protein
MDEFIKIIKDLQRRIDIIERAIELRNISIPTDGYLIVKKVSSDPVSPYDGEIWYNTTSDTYKCSQDGVIKTFTTS